MGKYYSYISAVKFVLLLAALNSVLWHLAQAFFPSAANEILYNIIRVAIEFFAGWLVIRKNVGNLLGAGFAGVLVSFIDHPVITGTVFIASSEFQAFIGVLISFAMFVWVAMIVGVLGGFARKKLSGRNKNETGSE
ncbi:MAG: hypothetical protein P8171_17110 [Candidatus Thiodiazotropha sp.]